MVNFARNICELFCGVRRITLVDNLVVMFIRDQLSEVEFLVKVGRVLLHKLRKPLLVVWMEGSWVKEEASAQDVFTKPVLRDHALNSSVEHLLILPLEHMFHRDLLQVSNIASVLAVQLVLSLAACHVLDLRVDHYTVVTVFSSLIRDVSWLVLPSQVVSGQSRDTTQGHAGGIEQVPGLTLELDGAVHRLRIHIGLLVNECSVNELVVDIVHSLSRIFVEWHTGILFLGLERLGQVVYFLRDLIGDVIVAFTPGEG
jgi:hypothetical protein